MKLAVQGIACLGSFGFGPDALRATLVSPVKTAFEDGRALHADTEGLRGIFPARSLRHTDHFSRMALYAAVSAVSDAGLAMEDCQKRTGLILATGYGPAASTFDFLDSLLANGDRLASPLSFSHSVQNIPAASIAMGFNLIGLCATVCQLDCPVTAALQLAWCWLMEEQVDRVLLGAVDEHTPILAATNSRLGKERATGRGGRAVLPLAEGAAFFCLERNSEQKPRRGALEILAQNLSPDAFTEQCSNNLFFSGKVPSAAIAGRHVRIGEKFYGNLPVAQAFDIILALYATAEPSACFSFGEQGSIGGILVHGLQK